MNASFIFIFSNILCTPGIFKRCALFNLPSVNPIMIINFVIAFNCVKYIAVEKTSLQQIHSYFVVHTVI